MHDLIAGFQNLIAAVPELVQPLIVALAGAVPFVEGEGATVIGIVGGIHPIVAAVAAAVGNFVCVAIVVLVGAGVRSAVTSGRVATAGGQVPETSPRREKFQRAFVRYGVPGVSLLGPLLLPTQLTSAMLAGAGVAKGRILVWQAIAITMWAAIATLIVTGVWAFAGIL
ncbi:small multidrug efflux protein [Microbacterium sp. RG1]|uniref:small multidrug efflux protein n=1 Tax=Microbacterium sp. RG1 TaxID=2489212 RepID=UPI0010CA59CE|nr:small multidrug efflux protein [Microbacterium sp. RG1]QCQ17635.1 small multidrug efflux protein [Microbacterium sp. RG1]